MSAFDYVCGGQISMFDFIKGEEVEVKNEPLLNIGDIIYQVVVCEIEKYIISGIFYAGGQFRYHTNEDTMEKGGNCFGESDIGEYIFLDLKDAYLKSDENKNTNIIMFAKDMQVERQIVFLSYNLTWFKNDTPNVFCATIAIVNKTMVYVQHSGLYAFMHSFSSEKEAVKFYEKELQEFDFENETKVGMDLENMYLCGDGRWSEAVYYQSHGFAKGAKVLVEESEDK